MLRIYTLPTLPELKATHTRWQVAMRYGELLGLRKVRYRGLAKNTAQLFTLFGLVNLRYSTLSDCKPLA